MRRCDGTFILLLLCVVAGCEDVDSQQRSRERDQVDMLQEQAREQTQAARALVEADAEARKQLVILERELQAERHDLSQQRAALEQERMRVSAARDRLPLLSAAWQGTGVLLLGIVALAICGILLRGASTEPVEQELEDLLLLEVAGESGLLREPALPAPAQHAAIGASLPPCDEAEGPD